VAQGLADQIDRYGLEAALAEIAAEVVPGPLDRETWLVSAEVDGARIIYRYRLADHLATLKPAFDTALVQSSCANPVVLVMLDGGATIVHAYATSDGRLVGTVALNVQDCGV
jgi:hypothetical protein